jgi:hypothetical protein
MDMRRFDRAGFNMALKATSHNLLHRCAIACERENVQAASAARPDGKPSWPPPRGEGAEYSDGADPIAGSAR